MFLLYKPNFTAQQVVDQAQAKSIALPKKASR